MEARGAVIGQSRSESIDRVVSVDQVLYGRPPQRERYQVARLIGQVLRKAERSPADRVIELPIHPGERALRLYADTPAQRVLCHLETPLGSA